jgi:hypothetical protein
MPTYRPCGMFYVYLRQNAELLFGERARRNIDLRTMRLGSRISVTSLNGRRRLVKLTTSSAYDLLLFFGSMGERGGICCHHRDDAIVRAVDQIVQIAGCDGPEDG